MARDRPTASPPEATPDAVRALAEYADDELAALYDLDYADRDDDLDLYEQFARRGDSPVLELAAGTGRVALRLARAGHDVVGLDSSPHMLARFTAKLDEMTAPRVRLIHADMRSFCLDQRFDLVYCALNSLEHLQSTDDQIAALRCVAGHLADGGAFVAQLRSPVGIDWSREPSTLTYEWARLDPATGDRVIKMSSSLALRARQAVAHTILFDRIGRDDIVRRRMVEVVLRVTGRFEIELVLERAGLRLQHVYGGPDLSPFTDDSDTMVIVAGPASSSG